MNTNNKQLTDTSKAILWWQNIMWDEKIRLCNRYLGMHPNEIYSPEIKIIYKAETSLIQSNIPLSENPTQEIKEDNLLSEVGFTKGEWAIRDYEVIGGYGSNKSICEMTGNFMDRAEKKANAQRIVQAVNNHDALVSALKEAMDIIERMDTDINSSPTRTERKRLTDLLNNISNK